MEALADQVDLAASAIKEELDKYIYTSICWLVTIGGG